MIPWGILLSLTGAPFLFRPLGLVVYGAGAGLWILQQTRSKKRKVFPASCPASTSPLSTVPSMEIPA